MAIFIDSEQQYYIGILFGKYDDCYSGHFLLPSNHAVRWLDGFLTAATRLLIDLMVLCMAGAAAERLLGPREIFNAFFFALAVTSVLVAIPYLVVGPLMLRRSRRRFRGIELRCLNDLSRRMYVFPLMVLVLVALSMIFMPSSSGNDVCLFVLPLCPMFIGLAFAVWYYSRPAK
jgi:hypothetical protein